MDISAFSEENFDVQEWINKTFRAVDNQENKEAFITSMVTKLQLYVQQVNGALEETSQQVLQNLPRVMHDSDMIHKEALLLKEKMKSVREEIAKIERDTGESMASLERLDRMKTELQTAKQALHEADNWTLLATDIEEVFESHNIDSIAEKVVSMQQSLIVLANSGDYEARRLQLEGFKNRLEAIASPHLVKAFTNNNITESKKYVHIFGAMERLPQLVKYYSTCQKESLCQQWRSLVDVDQDHGVSDWLVAFYDVLLSNWQTQVKWCQEVFSDWEMLPRIYCDVLAALSPNMTDCIETALKQQQSEQLLFLIQLKMVTQHFAKNLHNAFAQLGSVDKESWSSMCQGLYSPYKIYIARYEDLESRQMVQEFEGAGGSGAAAGGGLEQLVECTEAVGQRAGDALAIARRAHQRCLEFTHGSAYPALISAIEFFLSKYLEQYRSALRQIDLEKSTKDEWTMFRVCLTLLQNAGEFLLEVERLDKELVEGVLTSIRSSKTDDLNLKMALLSKSAQEEFNLFVSKIRDSVGDDSSGSILMGGVTSKLKKVCCRGYQSMFDIMFAPIASQLARGAQGWISPTTASQQMPDYSYAPLEYITQIGEYMMTLPQHLEPFVLRDNPGLGRSLTCTSVANNVATPSGLSDGGNIAADVLVLGAVARHACTAYTDLILGIRSLTPNATKQLAIDIGYFGNVLEDLGFGLSDNLEQICTLLKTPSESYQSLSSGTTTSAAISAKLVSAIRQMRNITSS